MTDPVACARCGRSRADDSPVDVLAWVLDSGQDGQRWLCPVCARKHVRDIEGKLPDEYW